MPPSSTFARLLTTLQRPAFTVGLLIGVMLLAAGLRLTDLDSNPPGLWQDEASTGLDAYLIWTTGQDRAGDAMPLISRSFGDYPLAGYRYLVAPIVGTLGLTIGHQRWVAAFFGLWMVLATYWAARQRLGPGPALGAALSGALAPTWLHFSRYGSEAILLPACLVTGWALIDFGRRPERRWGIWLGAVALGCSAYTYHAVKVFLPLWMLGFLIFQWPRIRGLWKHEKHHLIGPALLFTVLVLPSMQAALTLGGMARGRTVLAWYQFEGVALFRTIASNYLSYFDPSMLFVRGGPAVAQSIPGLGMWNMLELPLMLVGLSTLFKAPGHRRTAGFIIFWFLIGPLPGGLTYEAQNMGRAIAWLPAPQLISGWGLWVLMRWALRLLTSQVALHRRVIGGLTIVLTSAAWGVTIYAVYWCTLVRYPLVTERDWQFEITRAMHCALDKRTDEKLIVSPRFHVASVFARFHFADADKRAGKKIWQLGDRRKVRRGEIYLLPTRARLPEGVELCRVVHGPTQKVYAYVFGAHPEPESLRPVGGAKLKATSTFAKPKLDLRRLAAPPSGPPPNLRTAPSE